MYFGIIGDTYVSQKVLKNDKVVNKVVELA